MEPEVHHHIHTRPPPVPTLSQINPVQPPSQFLKIHFNIAILFVRVYSTWSFSVMSPHQNPVCTTPAPHMCYIPPHLIPLGLITRIVLSEEYRSLSS
jgi:hypothetical protein